MQQLWLCVLLVIATYPVQYEAQSNYGTHLASKAYVNARMQRFLNSAMKSVTITLGTGTGDGEAVLLRPPTGKTIANGKIRAQGLWVQLINENQRYLTSLFANTNGNFPETTFFERYPTPNSSEILIDFAGPYNTSTSTGLVQFDYIELP